jgi:VanZ family protein
MKLEMGWLSAALPTRVAAPEEASSADRTTVERRARASASGTVWSDDRIWLLAALAVATLIVYGSLVPFDLKWTDGLTLRGLLAQLQFTPWSLVSPTDLLVNIAVGAPLGFFLMGALRGGRRRGGVATLTTVLVVGCISALVGLGVELLQVLSPTRRNSWNDIWAQTFGATLGAMVWLVTGRAVIQWLRDLAGERTAWMFAVRLLQLYLPIYLLIQLTPFDSGRAAELATKFSGDALIPSAPAADSTFVVLFNLAGSALLTVPVGGLAVLGWVSVGARRPVAWAVLLGVMVVLTVGVAQEVVWRQASVNELLVGTLGITLGVAAATALPGAGATNPIGQSRRPVHRWFLAAAAVWMLILVAHSWYPFDFALTAGVVTRRLTRISLAPFGFYYWYAAYIVDPLAAVHETVVTFVMAVPLGSLLRLSRPVAGEPHIRRLQNVATIGVAIAVLLVIELGQTFLPTRFPDVTDLLIGAIGAVAGSATASVFACRPSTTVHRISPLHQLRVTRWPMNGEQCGGNTSE